MERQFSANAAGFYAFGKIEDSSLNRPVTTEVQLVGDDPGWPLDSPVGMSLHVTGKTSKEGSTNANAYQD